MNEMIEMPIQVLDIVIYIFVFVCDETCDNVAVVRRTLATSRHGSIPPGCHHHHNLGRHQLWCGGRRPQLQRASQDTDTGHSHGDLHPRHPCPGPGGRQRSVRGGKI